MRLFLLRQIILLASLRKPNLMLLIDAVLNLFCNFYPIMYLK